VANCEEKVIQISLQKIAHQGRITLADSGINISPEQRTRIFNMAYSGWKSSGKGLAFSCAIAEKYGGRLYLSDQSSLGGAVFVLELNLV
jgi:C4-dicarboxylate-specific signal transduction histidine kinase